MFIAVWQVGMALTALWEQLGDVREGSKTDLGSRPGTSALPRWSQPVDATLYLRGKRWSVGWNGDFIEVLLRQRRRSYGIAGSVGSR